MQWIVALNAATAGNTFYFSVTAPVVSCNKILTCRALDRQISVFLFLLAGLVITTPQGTLVPSASTQSFVAGHPSATTMIVSAVHPSNTGNAQLHFIITSALIVLDDDESIVSF